MDTRLLDAYNRELVYARDLAAEFAAEHPGIAAELGLGGTGPKDPYVERLLEGFAFLAARTQLKLDARHPEFTQHLLEIIYPGFLSPIPSCAIAEFVPDLKESALAGGVHVPRGSSLRAAGLRGGSTYCEFRTAQDVVLWPLAIQDVSYIVGGGSLAGQGLKVGTSARAALRIRMAAPAGVELASLPIDSLTFFINCEATLAARLQEQVIANCVGVVLQGALARNSPCEPTRAKVTLVGCAEDEALLPVSRTGMQGYRLLQEYFALPERLRFFRVEGVREALTRTKGRELELLIILDRANPVLENALDVNSIRLYCAPVVNLFPRSLDRVHVSVTDTEMLVTADRNRPMDFEIHTLTKVRAVGGSGEILSDVLPMHLLRHSSEGADDHLYYSMQRRARLKSLRQKQSGGRTRYLGSEVFISVTDWKQRQFNGDLRQLDVDALCTNRDLPLLLTFEGQASLFSLEAAAPLEAVRCLVGPTAPRDSPAFGSTAWRLISHLSLNYLSLMNRDPGTGASTLRSLLALYADPLSPVAKEQVSGVRSVCYQPVVRRIPGPGPIAYGRGLEISLTLDDAPFEGAGILGLGAVLEQFFARYVSINSFTQLRLESSSRGEIKRWPPRIGRRESL